MAIRVSDDVVVQSGECKCILSDNRYLSRNQCMKDKDSSDSYVDLRRLVPTKMSSADIPGFTVEEIRTLRWADHKAFYFIGIHHTTEKGTSQWSPPSFFSLFQNLLPPKIKFVDKTTQLPIPLNCQYHSTAAN
jgi:hypothetical protein